MKTLIAALILAALTLTTLIVAPLFPQSAPSANGGIIASKVIGKALR